MNKQWRPNQSGSSASNGRPGLSIVIPVYNGAATIKELLTELCRLKPEGGLEIILVNDGSLDDSAAVCMSILSKTTTPIVYLEHMRNYGEHNAVLTGLRHASGRFIVTMDDDLQNPAQEAVRLYDHARLNGFDVVYSRYAAKSHASWRNLGSRFANWVADRLLDKPKGLYLSSFRCMSDEAARAVASYRGPYPYVDGLLMQVTQRIGQLEVEHLPRPHGRSNYTVTRLLRLWLNLATSFSLAPLRLATVAGAAMAFVGAVGAAAVIVEALTVGTPSGWASVAAATLLIGGLQCLILGIIGEYVGRTFLSANGKPQSALRTAISAARTQERHDVVPVRAVVSL